MVQSPCRSRFYPDPDRDQGPVARGTAQTLTESGPQLRQTLLRYKMTDRPGSRSQVPGEGAARRSQLVSFSPAEIPSIQAADPLTDRPSPQNCGSIRGSRPVRLVRGHPNTFSPPPPPPRAILFCCIYVSQPGLARHQAGSEGDGRSLSSRLRTRAL